MNLLQGCLQGIRIHCLSAQDLLIPGPEGLDPDTDPGNARTFKLLQHLRGDVVRVKFQADPVGNDKVVLQGMDDLSDPVNCKGGRPSAEIEAGDLFPAGMLTPHHMDLPDQGIDIPAAQILFVAHLAVGTEAADAPAEGDMDIQSQSAAFVIGKDAVIFIFKGKGLPCSGKPGPCKTGKKTHTPPRYTSDR